MQDLLFGFVLANELLRIHKLRQTHGTERPQAARHMGGAVSGGMC